MLRYGSFSIIFTAIFWQGKWAGFILGAEERGKNFDTVVSKKKKKKRKTTALLRHSSCACLQQPESSQRGAGCVLASHCSMACFSPLPSAVSTFHLMATDPGLHNPHLWHGSGAPLASAVELNSAPLLPREGSPGKRTWKESGDLLILDDQLSTGHTGQQNQPIWEHFS